MAQLQVIYLKQAKGNALWDEGITALIAERHTVRIFDPTREVAGQFSDIDAVVDMGGASATQELVDAGGQARLWQIVTVGYDHFDMDMLRRAGIPVCNCPGSTSSLGLAEAAVMFMLMIVHRYNEAQQVLQRGELYLPMGEELEGKVLGLIGFGASGRELARLTRPLGLRLMIIEPLEIDATTLNEYQPQFVGKPEDTDRVFAEADFVSLHLPLSPETRGIISASRIGLMKPTASFINTARGDLVDQEALYQALLDDRIAAIGTDVHAGVRPQPDHPVYKHPNFYALPHIAGTTHGTVRLRGEVCVENLDRLAAGEELKYRVDFS